MRTTEDSTVTAVIHILKPENESFVLFGLSLFTAADSINIGLNSGSETFGQDFSQPYVFFFKKKNTTEHI